MFIEFLRFPDPDSGFELITLLRDNKINYEVDDTGLRYELGLTHSPFDNQVIVKIDESEYEKANDLYHSINSDFELDQNLDSLSDAEIIEIINNPVEWTGQEKSIAERIISRRGIDLNPKPDQSEEIFSEKPQLRKLKKTKIDNGAWPFFIGIFSVIPTYYSIRYSIYSLHFPAIFGLKFSELPTVYFYKLFNGFSFIGFGLSLLISSLFLLLAYFAHKDKKWAIISVLAIYGADLIYSAYLEDWFTLVFHIFLFAFILIGYRNLDQNAPT